MKTGIFNEMNACFYLICASISLFPDTTFISSLFGRQIIGIPFPEIFPVWIHTLSGQFASVTEILLPCIVMILYPLPQVTVS